MSLYIIDYTVEKKKKKKRNKQIEENTIYDKLLMFYFFFFFENTFPDENLRISSEKNFNLFFVHVFDSLSKKQRNDLSPLLSKVITSSQSIFFQTIYNCVIIIKVTLMGNWEMIDT